MVGCNAELGRHLRTRLAETQWTVREAGSGSEALEMLGEESSEMMLVSSHLPDLDVEEFQDLVRAQIPRVQIIVLSSTPVAGQKISDRAGLAQDLGELLHVEEVLPRLSQQAPYSQRFSSSEVAARGWQGIIGASAAMQRVYHASRLVAKRDTTVLIQGESGTGKDLLARAIHNTSPRAKQPFIVINCAAIPETLLEAELFGYTKGAFTGASQSRIGRVHAAHGGTLFLDEIGEMPLSLQSKILRFLEQGEVQRIGGTDTLKVDCRVIAATNVDLKKVVKAGQFREDLYYRLAIFPVQLPSLRERMEDVDALSAGFLARFFPGAVLHPDARAQLLQHTWPGNVRELRNVIERACVFAESRSEILPEDIHF